jgi:V/A-type H+-transporting ATPase subunit D
MTDTGRAGRIRVERRLLTARHGASLLDRKQRIMADELERLQLHSDRIREDWEGLAREAAVWLQRAAALDGRERIEAASPAQPAEVEIQWGGSMGVRYPEDALCRSPVAPPAGGSSALSYAAVAHRSALAAAVRQAAVQRAVMLLSAELTATRTRQRAVEHRWIPRLENELRAIRRALDEQELEESLRLRWAAGNDTRTAEAPDGSRAPRRTGSP